MTRHSYLPLHPRRRKTGPVTPFPRTVSGPRFPNFVKQDLRKLQARRDEARLTSVQRNRKKRGK
jgi:hypothetical protein